MNQLFPTPIQHTPPAHAVRRHLLKGGDENDTAEYRKETALSINVGRMKWMANEQPLTTREIAERIGRCEKAAYYILVCLRTARMVRSTNDRPIRWSWVGVPE